MSLSDIIVVVIIVILVVVALLVIFRKKGKGCCGCNDYENCQNQCRNNKKTE